MYEHILSKFNRKQVNKVNDITLIDRRRIIRFLKNENQHQNIIFPTNGINLEHFCLGQVMYFATNKIKQNAE